MRYIIKGFTLVGSVLFFLFAYWQFNDPDAFWWVVIYAVAAAVGLVTLFRKIPWQAMMTAAVLIISLGLYYVWIVISQQLHYFEDEVGREMMGSLMVGAYLGILAIYVKSTPG